MKGITMAKILYLKDENYARKAFSYENIPDLLSEFQKRNISIGYGASIGDRASIGDEAKIGDGIKLNTGFYITGSRHSVTYVGNGKISIGCHTKEIEWFKENYELLGKKENYSDKEIQEYKVYILMAEMFHNQNYKDNG